MSNSFEKFSILGIDIGGTGIKAAAVDPIRGKLLNFPKYLVTPKPATFEAILPVIGKMIRDFEWWGAIGCGFPGVVKNGMVHTAANLDQSWIGVNLAVELAKFTNDTAKVINDADAAGIAEMTFGAGKFILGNLERTSESIS